MASARPNTETQRLSIIIFKGGFKDDKNHRHCALYIEHMNPNQDTWRRNMLDIEGASLRWRSRESVGRRPEGSDLFLKKIPVKQIPAHKRDPWSDRRLRDCILSVAMNNVNDEWNCQGWLQDSLNRLTAARFITVEESEDAFNQALDAILWDR